MLEQSPYADSGRRVAYPFSACANGISGFSCPSTAAWYRWDLPIPINSDRFCWINRSIPHFAPICNPQFEKGLFFLSVYDIMPLLLGKQVRILCESVAVRHIPAAFTTAAPQR